MAGHIDCLPLALGGQSLEGSLLADSGGAMGGQEHIDENIVLDEPFNERIDEPIGGATGSPSSTSPVDLAPSPPAEVALRGTLATVMLPQPLPPCMLISSSSSS